MIFDITFITDTNPMPQTRIVDQKELCEFFDDNSIEIISVNELK